VVTGGSFEIATTSSSSWLGVAFDGTNHLVVWYQYLSGDANPYKIRGQRISPSGSKVGSVLTIVETASPVSVYDPDVASNGSEFLVTWRRYESTGYSVRGQRVTSAGALTGTEIIVRPASADYKYRPRVAYGDGKYAVVWRERVVQSSSTYYHVFAQLVDASTGALSGTALQASTSSSNYPSVAFGGSKFLIAWYYSTHIYGRILSSAGAFDTNVITISQASSSRYYPDSAFDGTNFLTAWYDYRSSTVSSSDIYGQRVSPSGTLVGTTYSNNFAISDAPGYQYYPAVTWCGGRYNVVFRDNRYMSHYVIFRQPVDKNGSLLDATGSKNILLYGNQTTVYYPAVECGGSTALAVWTENASGTYKVMGSTFTP
jgi:hypothetical protein